MDVDVLCFIWYAVGDGGWFCLLYTVNGFCSEFFFAAVLGVWRLILAVWFFWSWIF